MDNKKPVLYLLCLLFPLISFADVVKQSNSGICHSTESPYYSRVKNFTPYSTLQACLNAGGRLPKNSKGQTVGSSTPSSAAAIPALTNTSNNPKYKRSYFGGWADTDRDCVNTRHELLMKQSTSTIDTGSNKCTVSRGKWLDPYTGQGESFR